MRKKIRIFFMAIWILAVPLTSCAGVTPDTEVIDQGIQSARKSDGLRSTVITESEAFRKIHREIHAHELPPLASPEVNFQSSLVLIVTMAEKPSTGYGIDIDAITRSGETLEVTISTEVPDPDKFYATVMTQPYVMLEVKKNRGLKKVVFLNQAGHLIESLPIIWP